MAFSCDNFKKLNGYSKSSLHRKKEACQRICPGSRPTAYSPFHSVPDFLRPSRISNGPERFDQVVGETALERLPQQGFPRIIGSVDRDPETFFFLGPRYHGGSTIGNLFCPFGPQNSQRFFSQQNPHDEIIS